MTDAVYQGLYDQGCLPAKYIAATTLHKLLRSSEIARAFVRPGLREVLQVYLQLMNEIESEELVTALERLVQYYKEDMEPFAV